MRLKRELICTHALANGQQALKRLGAKLQKNLSNLENYLGL
jgi:hypothetical protein